MLLFYCMYSWGACSMYSPHGHFGLCTDVHTEVCSVVCMDLCGQMMSHMATQSLKDYFCPLRKKKKEKEKRRNLWRCFVVRAPKVQGCIMSALIWHSHPASLLCIVECCLSFFLSATDWGNPGITLCLWQSSRIHRTAAAYITLSWSSFNGH